MGKLLTIKLKDIRITQDFLDLSTVKKYCNVDPKKIPPIPITKDYVGEHYIALDGHHYLTSCYMNGKEYLDAWLCETPHDFMNKESFPNCTIESIEERNEQIKKRFEVAPFYVPSIKGKEIYTIESLIDICLPNIQPINKQKVS